MSILTFFQKKRIGSDIFDWEAMYDDENCFRIGYGKSREEAIQNLQKEIEVKPSKKE